MKNGPVIITIILVFGMGVFLFRNGWSVRIYRRNHLISLDNYNRIFWRQNSSKLMKNDWQKAKQDVEEFREMMEEIEDYLPETERYSFDDGTRWESMN